jgi:hypothetical protein
MGRSRKPHHAASTDTIAKHVCSPAIAQQLKELAVLQDRLWYWVASSRRNYPLLFIAEETREILLFHRVSNRLYDGRARRTLTQFRRADDEVLRFVCEQSARGCTIANVWGSRTYGLKVSQNV